MHIHRNIILSKPTPLEEPYIDYYKELYEKCDQFKELIDYNDKLDFWQENNLFGHYSIRIFLTESDITPAEYIIVPKTNSETDSYIARYLKVNVDLQFEKEKLYHLNVIRESPLPQEYIDNQMAEIEKEYNIWVERDSHQKITAVNHYNAFYFGYLSEVSVSPQLKNISFQFFVDTCYNLCRGKRAARLKGYLLKLKDQKYFYSVINSVNNSSNEFEELNEIPNNLKELQTIWHDRNDKNNLIKIYNEHKTLFENKPPQKTLMSCFAYTLYKEKWLCIMDSQTFNPTDIARIFFSIFNWQVKPKDKDLFDIFNEGRIFDLKYTRKMSIPPNEIKMD